MIKIKGSHDRLTFKMVILSLIRRRLYTESDPWIQIVTLHKWLLSNKNNGPRCLHFNPYINNYYTHDVFIYDFLWVGRKIILSMTIEGFDDLEISLGMFYFTLGTTLVHVLIVM